MFSATSLYISWAKRFPWTAVCCFFFYIAELIKLIYFRFKRKKLKMFSTDWCCRLFICPPVVINSVTRDALHVFSFCLIITDCVYFSFVSNRSCVLFYRRRCCVSGILQSFFFCAQRKKPFSELPHLKLNSLRNEFQSFLGRPLIDS